MRAYSHHLKANAINKIWCQLTWRRRTSMRARQWRRHVHSGWKDNNTRKSTLPNWPSLCAQRKIVFFFYSNVKYLYIKGESLTESKWKEKRSVCVSMAQEKKVTLCVRVSDISIFNGALKINSAFVHLSCWGFISSWKILSLSIILCEILFYCTE